MYNLFFFFTFFLVGIVKRVIWNIHTNQIPFVVFTQAQLLGICLTG